MGIFTNGYNANGISGKIGNTVFFLDKDKQQAARAYVANPENPRTETQQLNRVKTIGVAKVAKTIWRNRDITWLCLKNEKGSYYNTIFSSVRNNQNIEYIFVGASFGWAFTEYRTDDLTIVNKPLNVWIGKAGISQFSFYNPRLFIQDPFNPTWSFGVGVQTVTDLYGSKGNDNQVLAITIVSITQGYSRTVEFEQTRLQSKANGSIPQFRYIGITEPTEGGVYAFLVGFVDKDKGDGRPRQTSTQYFCGCLRYEIGQTVFSINDFQLPPNYE